jgi:hypothetical protein
MTMGHGVAAARAGMVHTSRHGAAGRSVCLADAGRHGGHVSDIYDGGVDEGIRIIGTVKIFRKRPQCPQQSRPSMRMRPQQTGS